MEHKSIFCFLCFINRFTAVQSAADTGSSLFRSDFHLNIRSTAPEFCGYPIILNMVLRADQKINIPDNTAGSELILVFQISAVTPFKNQYRNEIFSGNSKLRNVKFTGAVTYLAVAGILTVDIIF